MFCGLCTQATLSWEASQRCGGGFGLVCEFYCSTGLKETDCFVVLNAY